MFDLEEEQQLKEAEKPFYIIYPDETGGNWRIQAVPVSPDSFESRKALPEAYVFFSVSHIGLFSPFIVCRWRGVRDDKLSEVTGIPGGIFVHASGFIGGESFQQSISAIHRLIMHVTGNKTREGALEMAKKALIL